ncbi:unnamed protein product, partial [Polarella glacialis]
MATHGLFTNAICPFAHRATFALALRPLPHNIQWVPLSLQLTWAEKFGVEKIPVGQVFLGKSAEELKADKEQYKSTINATGEVPSLQLPSGEVVMESEIVAEYIDSVATQGTKLMPEDPLLASRVRLAMKRFNDTLTCFYQLLMNQDPAKDQECADAIKAKLTKFADVLDKNGPFCFGSSATMADVHCAPFLYRFSLLLPHWRGFNPLEGLPRLQQALKACEKMPEFHQLMPISSDDIIPAYELYANGHKFSEDGK